MSAALLVIAAVGLSVAVVTRDVARLRGVQAPAWIRPGLLLGLGVVAVVSFVVAAG